MLERGGARPSGLLLAGALGLTLYIIVHASLMPFTGWRVPETLSWQFLTRSYQTGADLYLNIAVYVPFGFLAAELLRENGWRHPFRIAVIAAGLLSFSLEAAQLFLPGRVTAWHDWGANMLGALLGALLAMSSQGQRVCRQVQALRARWLAAPVQAELGALLVLVWLIAQSNPAIPFFEAGHLVSDLVSGGKPESDGPWALVPLVVAIALNVCGFVLFVGVWISPRIFAGVPVLIILATGLLLKFFAAGLLLKAMLLESWFGPASVLGLIAGYFLGLVLLGARDRTRLFLSLLLIFAGGLMARMAGTDEGFHAMLRLFDWPHGQLGTFASVTRALNTLWPIAAFLYLAALFVSGWGLQPKR